MSASNGAGAGAGAGASTGSGNVSVSGNGNGASDAQAKLGAYLGVAPRVLLDDVYRAGEDYLCDTIDALEKEVVRVSEEAGRKRALANGAVRSASAVAPALTEEARAEIVAGVDRVWGLLMGAYEVASDMFEQYCNRNVFTWPVGLDFVTVRMGGGG